MFIRTGLIWLLAAFPFGTLTVFAGGEHFSVTASLELNGQGETQLVVQFAVPPGFKLYADQFQVEVQKPPRIIPLSLPVPQNEKDVFSGEQKLVYGQSFTAVYLIENLTNEIVNVTVHYQGCDEKTCFLPAEENFQLKREDVIITNPVARHGPPATLGVALRAGVTRLPHTVRHYNKSIFSVSAPLRLAENDHVDWLENIRRNYKVVAVQSGYMDSRSFLFFLDLSGQRGAKLSSIQQTWQFGKLWISVLLMILGGLALNLTPCVLPLIPVNLAIIGAGVRAVSVRRGFLLGMVYGLGIVLAYGALGLITVLTGAQFGALNASPWFNMGIALVFLALGLALLDIFMIDFSGFQTRFQLKGRGMFFILILGAISALLAGACVAPVVIAVLLLAADLYLKGQIIGLFMPFLLGIGMALPWPFAGAGLSFLPKPGKWMIHIKHIFAVVILMAAFYYGTTSAKMLYNKYKTTPTESAHGFQTNGNWLSFPDGLPAEETKNSRAARGKPVLIYFWATWCKNCKAMSASTFKDAAVRAKFGDFVCVKYQAENPGDKVTAEVLHEFGVLGLPTFVILKPNEAQ